MHQQHIPTTGDIFVGRQPIYTQSMDIVGYELLFRSGETNHASFLDGDQASAQVLLNTFVDMGLETLVGSKRAFINVTRAFLSHDVLQVLPKEQIVLELLEDLTVDTDLLEAVRDLSHRGYTIALDDFLYHEHLRPLLALADIVKLDFRALDHATLADHVARLHPYGVTLVAEKVETPDEFKTAHALGFQWFQGYFFCRPDIVKGQQTPTNRLALLHLLAQLHAPNLDLHTVEALVSRDVALSYKLLRLINAAAVGCPRKIDSLRQAIRLLGLRCVTTWSSFLLMARVQDKPRELLTTAVIRATMCEHLRPTTATASRETFFLVGLFSVLDALMDQPLALVLETLPLAEEICQALLTYEGLLGTTLQSVLAYEQGQWDAATSNRYTSAELTQAYRVALAQAAEWDTILTQT